MNEFERRRDIVHRSLNDWAGLLPRGAFHVSPSVKAFGPSSEAFAQFLLKESLVTAVPGSVLERRGEEYIRISFAASRERPEEALDRIEKALRRLD